MKTFKLFLKGLLLYVTLFIVLLWLSGIDSIVEQGYFIPWTLTIIVLITACCKIISYRELIKLSLVKQMEKLLETKSKK